MSLRSCLRLIGNRVTCATPGPAVVVIPACTRQHSLPAISVLHLTLGSTFSNGRQTIARSKLHCDVSRTGLRLTISDPAGLPACVAGDND